MNRKTLLHNAWSEMPTSELDRQLQLELQKEEPEEEVVLGIMRVLQEREENCAVEVTKDIQDAWNRYHEKTVKPKKTTRKCKWFIRAAVVAMFGFVILAIPQTVGAESLLDVFFRWTESVFEFFAPEDEATNPTVEQMFQTEHPGLQQVYDQLSEMGVTEPVVPTWLPEGFELTDLKVIPVLGMEKVYAFFYANDSVITLSYRMSADILPSKYEKGVSGVEVYEPLDVCHLIMDNGENLLVTWSVDGVACSINADIEKEEVYKLIDSIYRMEIS